MTQRLNQARRVVVKIGSALLVDGKTAHPTVQPVVRARVDLLLHRRRVDVAAGDVDLEPVDAGRTR